MPSLVNGWNVVAEREVLDLLNQYGAQILWVCTIRLLACEELPNDYETKMGHKQAHFLICAL